MTPGVSSGAPQVPAAEAGAVEIWGSTNDIEDLAPVRTSHLTEAGAWAAVALGTAGTDYGIKLSGDLVRLSGSSEFLSIPTNLATADVKAISTVGNKAAVALADGSFQLWGDARQLTARTMTPTALGGAAVDVAVGGGNFVAILLENGKVGMLTSTNYEIVTQDDIDVTDAVEIAAIGSQGFARLKSGGVLGFGIAGPVPTPANVTGDSLADPVVSMAAGPNSGMAVAATRMGKVYTWEASSGELLEEPYSFPASAVTGKVVDVAATSRYFAARTDSKEVLVWGQDASTTGFEFMSTVPEEVDGHRVADLVGGSATFAAIVSGPLSPIAAISAEASYYGSAGTVAVAVADPAGLPVSGTVTLSGAGAAQTAAVTAGKATFTIDKTLATGSYRLTAAYSGSSDLKASAVAYGYTVAKAKSQAPTFKANKAPSSKKKGKATITVGTGSGLAKAGGKATVTLKRGKTTKKINVTLSGGKKSISLPKLKKGTWKVQVSYNGDTNYVAQKSKSYNLKVKK